MAVYSYFLNIPKYYSPYLRYCKEEKSKNPKNLLSLAGAMFLPLKNHVVDISDTAHLSPPPSLLISNQYMQESANICMCFLTELQISATM